MFCSALTPALPQPCPGLGSALAQPWLSLGSALAQPWLSLGSALAQPWLSLGSALAQPWLSLGSALAQPWLSLVSLSLVSALSQPCLSLSSALAHPWLLDKVSRAFDLGHIDFIKTSHISFCLVSVFAALPCLCLDSALSISQPYFCLVSVLSLSVLARVATHNIVSAFLLLETTMAPVREDMDDALCACEENKNMLTQIIAIYIQMVFGLPSFPTFPRSPLLFPLL
jgi:hypothetical protein